MPFAVGPVVEGGGLLGGGGGSGRGLASAEWAEEDGWLGSEERGFQPCSEAECAI